MRFLFAFALGTTSLFALACGSTVVDDDDDGTGGDGGSECGPPPPGSGNGWCPAIYACIDGEWQDTSGACPEPECPASAPPEGETCLLENQACNYGAGPCLQDPPGDFYRCVNGAWFLESACEPVSDCPDGLPIDGSDCTGWENANDCYYDITVPCSADQDVADASCDVSTLTWKVAMPASCEGCPYADAASCEADAACRWLVPGCGENPLVAAGCAPVADCAPDSCADGATCSTYDAHPCWNTLCDSCSAPVSICEMIFAPGD